MASFIHPTTYASVPLESDRYEIQGGLEGLRNISFKPNDDVSGVTQFRFEVVDDGDSYGELASRSIEEVVNISIYAVNDAPEIIQGSFNDLVVNEGAALASLGLEDLEFGPGGGSDELSQSMTYQVNMLPTGSIGSVFLSDGLTEVRAGADYSLSDIQGMQFLADTDNIGTGKFGVRVLDELGAVSQFTLDIRTRPVNDAPIRTSGKVSQLVITEDSPRSSLGFDDLSFAAGGGIDEARQPNQIVITSIPSPDRGTLYLSNGEALSSGTSYTLDQIKGIDFESAPDANGLTSFAFDVNESSVVLDGDDYVDINSEFDSQFSIFNGIEEFSLDISFNASGIRHEGNDGEQILFATADGLQIGLYDNGSLWAWKSGTQITAEKALRRSMGSLE